MSARIRARQLETRIKRAAKSNFHLAAAAPILRACATTGHPDA
jgi:hypothetical protein